MKGADVDLSQEEVRNLGLRTARPTKTSDRCWAIKLDDAVLKRSSITQEFYSYSIKINTKFSLYVFVMLPSILSNIFLTFPFPSKTALSSECKIFSEDNVDYTLFS